MKVGWKDSVETALLELKNLKAFDLTDLSSAISKSLDLLNVYRLRSGIENYGYVS